MRQFALIVLLFNVYSPLFGQNKQNANLSIKLLYGNEDFKLQEADSFLSQQSNPSFQVLKFYIHAISFYQNGNLVWKENSDYHLIDASRLKSLNIKLTKPQTLTFTEIRFDLGVDSLTNVSGAMGGDLDPTKGMYWTWQSGYINFKLEGKSHLCLHPKKEFQFHLGGYKEPFVCAKSIQIHTRKTEILFDLKYLMDQLDLTKKSHLMLPGAEAERLSTLVSHCFY